MNKEASVSIRKIANGYIFDRSWQEGEGNKTKYCSEPFFVEKLPKELEGLLQPGYMKNSKKGKYELLADELMPEKKKKGKKYVDHDEYKKMTGKDMDVEEEEAPKKKKGKGLYGRK